jgi:hypothetical protein
MSIRISGGWSHFACVPALIVTASCSVLPSGGDKEPQQAWVQGSGSGGWIARAISTGQCPDLAWNNGSATMRARTRANDVAPAATESSTRSEAGFPILTCEAAIPAGARNLHIGPTLLPTPPATPRRLLILGDTGCRLKTSDNFFQDCNDPAQWPFPEVVRAAAAKKPDLVIHVGDYHYRESPCPADHPGCAGSAWGYGWDAWQADFFDPVRPLLGTAPWVFIRGNHETCARAGEGWMRFLDPLPYSAERSCAGGAPGGEGDFTAPYAVEIAPDTQLIVFDSAVVDWRLYPADSPIAQRYAAQFGRVRELAANKPYNIFIAHHPVLAYGGSPSGKPYEGNVNLLAAMRAANAGGYFPANVQLVLNGHAHLFEALDFREDLPATLVLGNSGSASEGPVDPAQALAMSPAPGATIRTFVTRDEFGFATLDRTPTGWMLAEWNTKGKLMLACEIRGARLDCDKGN